MRKFIDLTGKVYEGLSVIRFIGYKKYRDFYLCKCLSCGKEIEVRAEHIKNQKGCRVCADKRNMKNIGGNKYGRLTVLSLSNKKGKRVNWECECDCGKIVIVCSTSLISGNSKSCGCLRDENGALSRTKHGMYYTPEYRAWINMVARTTNPKQTRADRYIGRGITICDSWRNSFKEFYKDMGKRPNYKTSIDRIDNNKGYYKDNCRWATQKEQMNNMSRNHMIEHNGKTISISMWSELLNINQKVISYKIKQGKTLAEIIENNKIKHPDAQTLSE